MNTQHDAISRKLHEFINQIIFLEKKKIFNFKGLKLYPSEIHLILVMNEKPTNATQMAEKLHITSGAVSQTIARLEKKGVLRKSNDPYLKNELTLTFTSLGEKVFERYKQMQEAMDKDFYEKLASFSRDELMIVERFLDQILTFPSEIGDT